MKKIILVSIVLLGSLVNARAATIDYMFTATFGYYWENFEPGNQRFMIFPLADYYQLSDQTTWEAGAGGHPSTRTTVSSIAVDNTTISYTFNNPLDDILFRNTDYNSGNHSAQGVLGVVDPLVITAELGSSTGIMRGYTRIVSNDETWYGEPRFNYYSADVGELVYYEVNYVLRNALFTEDLFNQDFSYNLSGLVDFTAVVPVPAGIVLFGSGLIAIIGFSRRTPVG